MDNRRLNARAEMGATSVRGAGAANAESFLDRAIELTKANWEIIFYIGLMLLAVFTRLWDLGPRALHHDESIHAYYSNLYLRGGGYNYDPTYHGPFLYHIVALGFFLFGTNDAMSRIMPAIFGIITIGSIWFLRPFIGRIGAMIAVLLVTLSPSISYYSRSLRHDVFALAGLMVLFICLLWFMRTHQARWLYIGTVGFTIAFTSHELTYLVAFIFAAFLAIAAFLYPRFADRASYNSRVRRGDEDVNPITSALVSLRHQPWTIVMVVLIFFGLYALLFTNLFTKPQEILRGFINSWTYWLGQHEVERGGQPRYYYLLMMPIYEPLAFLAGIGTMVWLVIKGITGSPDKYSAIDEADADTPTGTDEYGVRLPSILGMRGLTLAFLAFWSLGALIVFSLAGERMPWLLIHSALPFTLLASAGLGKLITSVEWKAALRGGGAILGVAVLLFFFAAFSLVNFFNTPANVAGGPAEWQNALRGILLFLFSAGLLALAGWIAYKIMPSRALAVVAMTFAIVLTLYGLRSMMLLNYRHGDVPVEMQVYTQTAPDVPILADRIIRLSRDETAFDAGRTAADVTGGRSMQIAIDQSVEWPFDWYFRDMRSILYFNKGQFESNETNVLPPNVPVILASDELEANAKFQESIKDKYSTEKYVLRWWFPEEIYKTNNEGDLGKTFAWLTSPAFTRYLMYRDPGLPLGSTNVTLHVRNDLAAKTGIGGLGDLPTGGSGPEVNTDVAPIDMFEGLGQSGVNRGQFELPRGIAQDPSGNFYVVDTANMRIQRFDPSGEWLSMFGSKGTSDGQFNSYAEDAVGTGPGGIAVDEAGNVYVADTWNHRIQKFDKDGKFLAKWGSFINLNDDAAQSDAAKDTKFFGPRAVAVGPDGNVYVTDTGNKRVVIFDATGKYLRQISSGLGTAGKKAPEYPFNQPGEMNEPMGIAVDGTGNVYVADRDNRRIQKFDNTGKFVAQWPITGTNWESGSYVEPFLATDAEDNLYVTAPTGKTVLKYSPTGELLSQKNREGAITLQTPTGLVVAEDGKVYVVDTGQSGVVDLGSMP